MRQLSGFLSDYLEGITEQNLQVPEQWEKLRTCSLEKHSITQYLEDISTCAPAWHLSGFPVRNTATTPSRKASLSLEVGEAKPHAPLFCCAFYIDLCICFDGRGGNPACRELGMTSGALPSATQEAPLGSCPWRTSQRSALFLA